MREFINIVAEGIDGVQHLWIEANGSITEDIDHHEYATYEFGNNEFADEDDDHRFTSAVRSALAAGWIRVMIGTREFVADCGDTPTRQAKRALQNLISEYDHLAVFRIADQVYHNSREARRAAATASVVEEGTLVLETISTVTMWHGGRNVETDYLEVRAHKKGRWEHGPGLYLTSHYDRAVSYAKGGGKTYKVTFQPDPSRRLDEVVIPATHMIEFVQRHAVKRLQPKIIADLRKSMERRGTDGIVAEVIVNLLLNWEAIPNSKTDKLRQFIIDHGVDYMKTRYGGRDETVVAIINPRIIKKVEIVPASQVSPEDFILSTEGT